MAINSTSLAWKIPWTEDSGRLKFMGLQKGLTSLRDVTTNNIHIYMCVCVCVCVCVCIHIHTCMLAREDRKIGRYRGEESRQKA